MELKFLLFLTFVVSTLAGPIINSERCSTRCTGTQKFGYKPGSTYEYDYTAAIDTTMQGAAEDKAGVKLTTKVNINVVSKCEFSMRLQDVRLHETDQNAPQNQIDADSTGEFKRSLEALPLAFSFQDGVVAELCTSKQEKAWALNVKRGILSALQNSMDDLKTDQNMMETDVAGECSAEYKLVNNGWYTTTIKKSKNLLGCVKRNGYNTLMQGTPYRVQSEIQSLPLVKGSHECTQDISKAGIIQTSVCVEEHVLRPFSRDSSGAVTKTTQTLKYLTERSSSADQVPIEERQPLIFAHSNGNRGSKDDVIRQLREVCSSTSDSVKPDTPKLFVSLVRLMKALDSTDLEQVFRIVKGASFCKSNQKRVEKFFLDAIPMLGTQASLRMIATLIGNKEVTGIEANMWLTTLAFIKDPTKDMLIEVKPLLSSEGNDKAMLGISSLIHSYCRRESCENDIDIVSMVSAIENKIGVGCYVDKDNTNKVLMSLKSLGNAGYVQNAVSSITKCMSRKDNPTEIRLAAIQAFRRMPCSVERDDIMALVRNRDEDSELRIAAYLAIMKCPSDIVLSRVRYLLETEEVNQVGSFVWSHLTNLAETSNPLKQEIKRIINDRELKKHFDLEKLKYSRNYEGSLFLEKLNTGASIDSNVIWSSKSFLPRSAMTNITFDLFGHSVNLLEIGGRIEGLEYFLESYFGPNGYFRSDDMKDVSKQSIRGISDRKMESINKQYGSEMDALKGEIYLRVFGNELMYTRLAGLDDITNGKSINIMDIVNALANRKDYTFTQNFMFMDSSMIIPTIAGLPLNLTIEGSATIDLTASGKFDIRRLTTKTPSLSIEGSLKPSGSVQINSMMSIDAFVTKSGMKMVSTMHSVSSVEGQIELHEGKILSAQLKTPFDKVEVFNVKTAFFTVNREVEREQKMITKNRQTKKVCSGDKLSKITGLELCAEIQYPNASLKADAPYFPLTGPISAGITLHKRDTHASYNLEYKLVKSKGESRIRAAFNTPRSTKVNRQMIFDVLFRPDPVIEVTLISPWKQASIRGALVGDGKQKQLTGRIVIDNENEYSITGEWIKSRKGQLFTYNPYVEIIVPNTENIKLSSKVEFVAGKNFDGEITLSGLSKQPIHTKVSLISKKAMQSIKTSISFEPGKDYSFETRYQKTETKKAIKFMPFLSVRTPKEEKVAFGGSLEYKTGSLILVDLIVDRLLDQKIKLYTKIVRSVKKSGTRYQSKVDVTTPVLRLKGNTNFVLQKSSLISRVNMDYVIPKVSRDRITGNSKVSYRFTKSVWSVNGNGQITFKRNSDYDVSFSTDMSNKGRLSKVDFDLKYGAKKKDENKRIIVSSLVRHELGWKKSDLDVTADIKHLAMGVDLKIKGGHRHTPKNLESNIGVVYGKKKSASATLKLKDKSRKLLSYIGEANLKWNEKDFSISNNMEQKNNKRYSNELTAIIAGHKSKIVSEMKIGNDEYDVSTDVKMDGRDPVHVEGMISLDPRNFRIRSQLNNDYLAEINTQYKKSVLLRLSGDFTVPSRRVKGHVEAKKKGSSYFSLFDIQWDVSNDKSKQVLIDTQVDVRSKKDLSAFMRIKTPFQNSKMDMNRKVDSAHFDLVTNGAKQLSLDGSFIQKNEKTQCSLTVNSVYKPLQYVKIDLDHVSATSQYETNFEVSWKPDNRVSYMLVLQRPISFHSIHATMNLKTPFKSFQSTSLELSHDVTNEIKSLVKIQTAEKSIQFHGSAKKDNDVYRGHLGVKSNIPSVRSVSVAVSHQHKDNTMKNSLSLDLNGKKYNYEGRLTHDRAGLMVQQSGNVLIGIRKRQYIAKWEHKNTLNDMSSVISLNLNKNIYNAEVKGRHNLKWREAFAKYTVKGLTPSSAGQISVSHSHSYGSLDTIVTMSKDSKNVFTTESHLKTQDGELIATGRFLYQDREIMATEGKLKTGITKYVSLTVSTPSESFKRFNTEIEFKGDIKSMTSSASIEMQPFFGNIRIMSTLNRIGGISGNVRLESPFHQIPYSEITFSNRPENEKTRTDIKLEYLPRRVIGFTSRILLVDKTLDADLSIVTPFERLRRFTASASNKATTEGYITKLKIEYPKGKVYSSELKTEFQNDHSISAKLNLPDDDPIFLRIGHKGSWERFSSGAELQLTKKEKHSLDVKFTNGKKIQGSIDIKSPSMNDISASFSHLRNKKDLKSAAMINYGQRKPIKFDFDGTSGKRIKGSIKLSSPWMDDIAFSVSHKGGLSNFRTKTKAEWGKKQEIDGELSFNFVKNLDIEISISTPFRNLRKISSRISHEGDVRNFKCQTEVKVGKNIWTANIKSKLNPIVSAEMIIRTPHKGYEAIKALITHDGKIEDFKCHIEMSKNKDTIIGDLLFKSSPVHVSGSLQTPFRGYRNLKAQLSHIADKLTLETKGTITYSDSNTISLVTSLNLESGLQASVNVKTPFKTMEDMTAKLSHSGTSNNFVSRFETLYQKSRSQIDVSFTTLGPVEGKLTVVTPNYRPIKVSFLQDEISHESQIVAMYGRETLVNGKLTLTKQPTMKGELSFRSKYTQDLTASMETTGKWNRFASTFKCSLGTESGEMMMNIDFENDASVEMTLKSPFRILQSGRMSFNHRGQRQNFQTSAYINIDDMTGSGNVQFSSLNGIDLNANLKTPYTKDLSLKVNHVGTLKKFLSNGEIKYGYKSASAQFSVDMRPENLQVSGYIKSPFTRDISFSSDSSGSMLRMTSKSYISFDGQKLHEFAISFNLEGNLKSWRMSANGEYNKNKVSASSKVRASEGLLGNIEMTGQLETPISLPMSLELIHTRKGRYGFRTTGDITYSGRKQHKMLVELEHTGNIKMFSSKANAEYNRQKVTGDVMFDITNGVQSTVTLKSTFFHDIEIVVEHRGNLFDFTNSAHLSYGRSRNYLSSAFKLEGDLRKFKLSASAAHNSKSASLNIKLDTTRDIILTLTLQTPNTKDITMSISHQGDLNDFISHGEIIYNGRQQHEINVVVQLRKQRAFVEGLYNGKKISLEAALERSNGYSGKVVLKTPFTDDLIANGEFNGDSLNFHTNGDLTYSGRIQHSVEFLFEHIGDHKNFRTSGSVAYNKKRFSIEIEFDAIRDVKGRGILRTPFTSDIEISFEHSGSLKKFKSSADISYSGAKQHDFGLLIQSTGSLKKFDIAGNGQYNKQKVSVAVLSDMTNGIKLNGRIETPFTNDIIISFEHQGNSRNIRSKAEVTYSGTKQHDLLVTFRLDGTLDKFHSLGTINYNNKQSSLSLDVDTTSGLSGKTTLKTPVWSDIQLVVDHPGFSRDLQSRAELIFKENKHEILVTFKHEGNLRKFTTKGNFKFNNKITSLSLDVDTLSKMDIAFVLRTPKYSDLRLEVTTEGTLKDFSSRGQLEYSGKIQHSLTANFKLKGTLRKFTLEGKATYNDKTISSEIFADTSKNIDVQANLKSPFTEDITISLQHHGELKNFESQLTTSYAGKQQYSIKAKFSISGFQKDFSSVGLVSVNDQEMSVDLKLDFTNGIDGKLKLNLPSTNDITVVLKQNAEIMNFDGRAEISYNGAMQHELSISMKHSGDLHNFRSFSLLTYNRKAVSSDVSFNLNRGLELTIQTPITGFETNSAKATYIKNESMLFGKWEIQSGKYKAQINSKVESKDGLLFELCVKTPFTKDFEVIVSGDGRLNQFKVESSIGYGKNKVRGVANHEFRYQSMKGSMLLETPMLEDINMEYDIRFDTKSFASNTKASVGNMNEIKEETTVNLRGSSLSIDSKISSKIAGTTRISQLKVEHDGEISNFRTSLLAKLDEKEIKASASFHVKPTISGSFGLQTPFHNIRGNLEHAGTLRSFTTSGHIEYAPDNKFEGKVTLRFNQLTDIYLNADLLIPSRTAPHVLCRYSHDYRDDNLKSAMYFSLEDNKPLLNGELKMNKKLVDAFIVTPKNRYSAFYKLNIDGQNVIVESNIARGSDRIILTGEMTPTSLNANIETPFTGYERHQITSSINDPNNLRFNLQGSAIPEVDVETNFKKTKNSIQGLARIQSGIQRIKDIRLSMNIDRSRDVLTVHADGFFNSPKGITFDASIYETEVTFLLSSPCDALRNLDGKFKIDMPKNRDIIVALANMKINQNTVYDIEIEGRQQGKEIHLKVGINEPRPMQFEIQNIFSPKSHILVNWNKLERDSQCRLDMTYNEDWSDNTQVISYKGNCVGKIYEIRASSKKRSDNNQVALHFLKDDRETYGLEFDYRSNTEKVTLIIPSRKIEASRFKRSSYGLDTFETSFSWDVERDQNKRFVVKKIDKKRGDGNEVSLALELPSLGESVQFDTRMLVNSGNVIYDGHTAFKYSTDSRKTLTLSSKLEDISGRGDQYKLQLGISHPYTTVDFQTQAQITKGSDKLAADIDIKYLTAKRQTKNIALMTEIDKIRRQLNLKVRSPVKSMSMEASFDTKPYRLSFKNLYDDSKPINTELTVDPEDASLDFNMNYDIDNPKNTLHVKAEFNDVKGLLAELYRNDNDRKMVDSLVNLRLKTSRILHTRVNWRPTLLTDLKDVLKRRTEDYLIRSSRSLKISHDEIRREINYKKQLIRAACIESIKPYTQAADEIMSDIISLRDRNAYYLRDVSDSLQTAMTKGSETKHKMLESWRSCQMKNRLDEYINSIQGLQQRLGDYSSELYGSSRQMLNGINYNTVNKIQGMIGKVNTALYVQRLQPYTKKLQNMNMEDHMNNIANQYTSAIYNVRGDINRGLINTLPTPVYNMGSSAYKYWEFEENLKALVNKAVEEVKKDATKEATMIKDILANLLKSKIIMYDIANGKIEIDLYLPVDVKSLTSVSDISLRKYLPRIPNIPNVKLGSLEDYIPHLSWEGHASIDGARFTTFDGQEYDFSGRCSYVLAKDYVDGNFSMILNFIARQKKKLIVTAHRENVQLLPGGKVRIDGALTKLPYKSPDFAVFADEGKVFVEGNGFQISTDDNVDKIDIDLSKWYFGKTGGLLGTLNHERYDDMLMPNHQITSDAFALGNAWQVEEKCR